MADEYPALELVAKSPLKSPAPVMLERSRDYLGAPFMVTVRAPGVVAGPDYFDPPKDAGLALQLAEQLALLHAVDAAETRRALIQLGWPMADSDGGFGRYECIEQRMDGTSLVYAAASEMRADGCALAY